MKQQTLQRGCVLARSRNMSQATARDARMCQGTFFFTEFQLLRIVGCQKSGGTQVGKKFIEAFNDIFSTCCICDGSSGGDDGGGTGRTRFAPVAPVAPTAPAAPVGPVAPVGPAGPVGPVAPVGPAAPSAPAGPAGPVAPVGPVGPAAPVAPVGPVGPTAPVAPVGPVGPVGPAGPVAPSSPSSPVAPVGPTGPIGPGSRVVLWDRDDSSCRVQKNRDSRDRVRSAHSRYFHSHYHQNSRENYMNDET